MIDSKHSELSIVRQCELSQISRSSFYYRPTGESSLNLKLMRMIDEQYLRTPFYGSRQMARYLRRQGYKVGRKRIQRLMRKMGLSAIYQAPNTSKPNLEHKIYPYLLRDVAIEHPDHVWCSDITYSAPSSRRRHERRIRDLSMSGMHSHSEGRKRNECQLSATG